MKQSSGSHFVAGRDPEKGFPRKSLSGARCVLTFPEQVIATELVLGNSYMPPAGEGFHLCISLLHPYSALKITLLQDFRLYPQVALSIFQYFAKPLMIISLQNMFFTERKKERELRRQKW